MPQKRLTPKGSFKKLMDSIRFEFRQAESPLKFHLFTEGGGEQLMNDLGENDTMLHSDGDAVDSFYCLVYADYLIAAHSLYSKSAGQISNGTVFWRKGASFIPAMSPKWRIW